MKVNLSDKIFCGSLSFLSYISWSNFISSYKPNFMTGLGFFLVGYSILGMAKLMDKEDC